MAGHHVEVTVFRPLLLLLALLTLASSTARAAEFRIRRAAVRANGDVQLYHEPSPEAQPGDVAQATLGGRPCVPVPDSGTAADELAVVVVLDRGGSDRAGMRPFGNAMRAAVKQFIQTSLQRRPAMTFALVDAAGPRAPPVVLDATSSEAALSRFLDEARTEPAGSGADVYGAAQRGIGLLEAAPGSLRLAIVLTDGVDPLDAAKADGAPHQALVDAARRTASAVSAVHFDRSAIADPAAIPRIQSGRARLQQVVQDTGAEWRTLDVSAFRAAQGGVDEATLTPAIVAHLDAIAATVARLSRFSCRPEGHFDASPNGHEARMTLLRAGRLVASSATSPPALVPFASAIDYPVRAKSGSGCSDDAGCEAWQTCAAGECVARTCSGDADCGDVGLCADGTCRRRRELKDLLLPIAGGTALLLGLVGLWTQRRRSAARAELARQQAESARQAQAAETEALRARLAAEEVERRRVAEQASLQGRRLEELESAVRPVICRLVSAEASGLDCDLPLRAGTYLVGSAPPAHIVFDTPTVSSRHAEIEIRADGRVRIRDLGSSNGTYINETALGAHGETELRPGDLIHFSRRVALTIRFEGRAEGGR